MDDIKIKEAFLKVKEDINQLKDKINSIIEELDNFKRTFRQTDTPTNIQTDNKIYPTYTPTIPSNVQINKIKTSLEAVKTQNSHISTGNRGVPADRQTIEQTDQQTDNCPYQSSPESPLPSEDKKFALIDTNNDPVKRMGKVAELVNSLDTLKMDLRRQFKKLTPQEMVVYSTIYQLTNQAIDVDYTLLSKKTGLSESSIRDYVQKLLKKGIPLHKIRENNKRILLSIPPEFKRMASLETLVSLRNL